MIRFYKSIIKNKRQKHRNLGDCGQSGSGACVSGTAGSVVSVFVKIMIFIKSYLTGAVLRIVSFSYNYILCYLAKGFRKFFTTKAGKSKKQGDSEIEKNIAEGFTYEQKKILPKLIIPFSSNVLKVAYRTPII
jgi:hypothetical protein